MSHRLHQVIAGLLLFALGFSCAWLVFSSSATGNVVADTHSGTYTWTTAVCNDRQQCIDVRVTCEDGMVTSLTPVSDLHQFSEVWEDPRVHKQVFCS